MNVQSLTHPPLPTTVPAVHACICTSVGAQAQYIERTDEVSVKVSCDVQK